MSTVAATFLFALALAADAAREPVVGLPCERCDGVFVGRPANVPTTARIAPANEPGEPMHLSGRVLDATGKPVAGMVIYAYHTDAGGIYPSDAMLSGTPAERHGRLRGWVRSDADGRYAFDTIRPAPYPGRGIPAHVHLHVIEPGRCTYYIDDVLFDDDSLVDAKTRASTKQARGGYGVVAVHRDGGAWQAVRDIRLGENIPDHARCAKPGA